MRVVPKYRLEYAKRDFARFLSHLELLRSFNRAFRRSGLPLAYTGGFHPRPRVSFGPPLAVGVAGLREYLDFELEQELPLREIFSRLARELPAGLAARQIAALPPGAPGLGRLLDCAWYQIVLSPCQAEPGAWGQAVRDLTEDPRPWLYRRAGKERIVDVKAGVKGGRLVFGENPCLHLLVHLGPREIPLREVLEVLWEKAAVPGPPLSTQLTRVGLFRQQRGALVTPLGEVLQFDQEKEKVQENVKGDFD